MAKTCVFPDGMEFGAGTAREGFTSSASRVPSPSKEDSDPNEGGLEGASEEFAREPGSDVEPAREEPAGSVVSLSRRGATDFGSLTAPALELGDFCSWGFTPPWGSNCAPPCACASRPACGTWGVGDLVEGEGKSNRNLVRPGEATEPFQAGAAGKSSMQVILSSPSEG